MDRNKAKGKYKKLLKIGEAAAVLGVSIDTLRRWDQEGKLSSIKTPGGTRYYSLGDLRKINPEVGEIIKTEKQERAFDLTALSEEARREYLESPIGSRGGQLARPGQSKRISGVSYPSQVAKEAEAGLRARKLALGAALAAVVIGLVATGVVALRGTGLFRGDLVKTGSEREGAGEVLAITAGKSFLEIGAETVFKDRVDFGGSADGFSVFGGDTVSRRLTVTGADVALDQSLTASSSPTFASLKLSGTSDQIVVGGNGTLTWTPTAARTVTFPDATGTVVLDTATQTLSNKSLSGSSNTFTNIPNSALSNSKITINAGTNLGGGGDVSLGSSVTIDLDDAISLTSATFSGTLGVGGTASVGGQIILDGATAEINATNNRPLDLGFENTGAVRFLNSTNYVDSNNNLYINGVLVAGPTTQGYWQRNSGALAPTNITDSLVVGGTATASGKFQVYGLSALNPVASISGSSSKAAFIVDNTVGDLFTASSSGLNRFVITQNGNVGIGTSAPAYKLDVNGSTNIANGLTIAAGNLTLTGSQSIDATGILSIGTSNQTSLLIGRVGAPTTIYGSSVTISSSTFSSNAATISGTLGVGGEASFSAKIILDSPTSEINATNRRYLDLGFMNTGGVRFLNDTNYITPSGDLYLAGSLISSGTQAGFWQRPASTGALAPINITDSLLIGGTATSSAKFQVYGLSALNPVASISASSAVAGLMVDNTVGDLFTASSSGLNRFVITQNGNVGIGTTAPVGLLDVAATAPFVITSAGQVGIGTTSPVGLLHVQGACVTGDTLIRVRRRKKKKNGDWEDEWLDLPIKQLKAGDEVMTLDERTGEFTTSVVRELMDKGIKTTFKLMTADGKSIRTTAEHPYLVQESGSPDSNFLSGLTFASVKKISQDYYFTVLSGRKVAVKALDGEIVHFTSEGFSHITHEKKSEFEIMTRLFALSKVLTVLETGVKVSQKDRKIVNGKVNDYWTLEEVVEGVLTKVVVRSIEDGPKQFLSVVWKDKTPEATKNVGDVASRILQRRGRMVTSQRRAHEKFYTTILADLSRGVWGYRGISLAQDLVSKKKWVKVRFLKPGMEIATFGPDGRISWQKIESIEKVGEEQVYDIEVENTHNFVAGHYIDNTNQRALISQEGEILLRYLSFEQKEAEEQGDHDQSKTNLETIEKFCQVNHDFLLQLSKITADSRQIVAEPILPVNTQASLMAKSPKSSPAAKSINKEEKILRTETLIEESIEKVENLVNRYRKGEIRFGGIVAHNTTGKALVDLNYTGTDQAILTASVSGTTKFVINNSGQVGVGTGANNNTLLADVDLRTLTNTVPVASIAGSTGVAALVVDNVSGDLFTASSSGLSRFVIDRGGNVGISSTAPSQKLDVVGAVRLGANGGANDILNTTVGGSAPSGVLYWGNRTLCDTSGNCSGVGGIVAGSGVQYYISKWTDASGTTIGDSLLYDPGTSVGLNTTSPAAIFDIRGTQGTSALSGTLPVASISGKTSFAAVVVNNDSTVGDLFTASASGLSRFVITNTGNVGIGTALPAQLLSVAGAIQLGSGLGANDVLNTAAAGGVPSGLLYWGSREVCDASGNCAGVGGQVQGTGTQNYITKWNNAGGTAIGDSLLYDSGSAVGLGTTSPLGTLHVVGQCVVSGTRIRRRRRRRGYGARGAEEWVEEEVPIEEIEPDDEIVSLNVEKGRFEWHKVEKTLNKGLLAGMALSTSTGKRIVTTGKHPYLMIDKPEITQGTFEVDQSIKVEDLGKATIVGFALGKLAFAVKLRQQDKKLIRSGFQKAGKEDLFAPLTFANVVVNLFRAAQIYPARIALDEEYTGFFGEIKDIIKKSFPDAEVFETNLKDSSAAHQRVWAVNKGRAKEDVLLVLEGGELKERPGVKSTLSGRPLPLNGYRGTSQPIGLYYGEFYHRGANLSTPSTSSGLIARKTELSRARWAKAGDIRVGQYVATEDGFEKVTGISDAGRVLMYDLSVANTHNFLANGIVAHNTGTMAIATVSGATSFAALTVDNSGVGDLFTASSSGLNRFVITQNGNVGIGTTAPVGLLDVAATAPFVITSAGQVGIGTTSPVGLLHVQGACVTGDTLLKRRRKKWRTRMSAPTEMGPDPEGDAESTKKSAYADLVNQIGLLNGWLDTLTGNISDGDEIVKDQMGMDLPGVEPGRLGVSSQPSKPARPMPMNSIADDGDYYWEDVRIDEIEAGDEVMTLDEKSGEFVASTVKQLMVMGNKKIIKLTTESGKTIRTTEKHPYLVKVKGENQKTAFAFIDETGITLDPGQHHLGVGALNKKEDGALKDTFCQGGGKVFWRQVSTLKPGMLIATVDGFEKIIRIEELPEEMVYDIEVENTHNFVAGHYVDQASQTALKAEEEKFLCLYQQNTLTREFSLFDLTEENPSQKKGNKPQSNSYPGSDIKLIQSGDHMFSNSQSSNLMAIQLQSVAKMRFAVKAKMGLDEANDAKAPNMNPVDRFESIDETTLTWLGRILKENSINLTLDEALCLINKYESGEIVYGGIVAHNTTGKALANLNYTGTDQAIFTASQGGVLKFSLNGIGTEHTASVAGTTSKAALIVDNTIGDLFTASSSGLARFVITQSGNVGIGSAAPSVALDVTGAGKTSGAFTVGNNLTVTAGGLTVTAGNIALTGSQTIDGTGTLTIGGTSQTSLALGRSGAQTTISGGPVVVNGASFASAGTTTFTGGNVGIGTTTVTDFALEMGGSIGPVTTDQYDLGSAALEWNNLYVKNIISTGTTAGFWQRASGVLAPQNITDSLIIGGTATSSGKFQVYGLSALNPVASISGSSAVAALMVDNTVGDLFTASSSGLNRFVITQNGNVGIGSTVPVSRLDTGGGTISLNGGWLSNDGGAEGVFVKTDGNVGIGTSAPAYRLDVVHTTPTAANGSVSPDQIGLRVNRAHYVGTPGPYPNAVYGVLGQGQAGQGSASVSYSNTVGARGVAGQAIVNVTGGASVTGASSLYALNATITAGTLSNQYGLYVESLSGASNNYGVYVAGNNSSYFGGNVGIGTTSPVGLLHVQGACVTGDTLLKRRRKRKSKYGDWEEDYWEDIRIDEIEAGDEILTFDETTGGFTASQVRELMDMGKKTTFKLVTEGGKEIRTTANHPYLVKSANTSNFFNETFKVVAEIARAYYFATLTSWDPIAPALNNERISISEEGWHHLHHKARSRGEMLTRYFALPKAAALLASKEARVTYEPGGDGVSEFWSLYGTVDDVQVKVVVRSVNKGPKYFYSVIWKSEVKEDTKKRAASCLYPQCGGVITPQLFNERIIDQMSDFVKKRKRDYQLGSYLSGEDSTTKWVKVKQLKPGMEIATVGGDDQISWQKIKSIEKIGEEQVFDIEVENTHNFVANGIVAHNTTGKALANLNYTGTDQAIFTASQGGTLKFALNGTGTDFTASVAGTTSKAALIVDNTVGDLFTASSSGLNRFVITQNGNVGIGMATPSATLEVRKGPIPSTFDSSLALYSAGQFVNTNTNWYDTELNLLDTRDQAAGVGGRLAFGGVYRQVGTTNVTTFAAIGGYKENSTSGDYAGYLSFETRPNGGIFTEQMRVSSAGNVGIGTTSPVGLLHVQGACVTGDTLIRVRRRKKKKNGEWEDEWLDVPIKDIQAGDEVATLDEKTGEFIVSKVKQLMNMGRKVVFELLTESGKVVKTTENHPYLVDQSGKQMVSDLSAIQKETYEFAEKLGKKYYVNNLAGRKVKSRALGEFVEFSHSGWNHFVEKSHSINELITRFFALPRVVTVIRSSPHVTSYNIVEKKDMTIEYWELQEIIDHVLVKVLVCAVDGGPKFFLTCTWLGTKENEGVKPTKKELSLSPRSREMQDQLGRRRELVIPQLFSRVIIPKKVKWVKVKDLTVGVTIATKDGWEKVVSIKKLDEQQVYDIEVENTHNFVANGIVAHNTTGKALVDLNTTGDQAVFTASVSGTTKFVINNSGQVGVGTGANNNTLLADVDLRTLTNTVPVASISGSTGVAALVVDNVSGDVFTASTSGLSRFVIDKNGNVGIGSSAPGYKLDVSGTAHVTGAVTLDTALTVANGGTGAQTFTDNGVLFGNLTAAIGATAEGATGQCLIGNTGSAPSWSACTTASGQLWQEALGVVAPLNITDSLIIGKIATPSGAITSGSMQIYGVNNLTPVASISGVSAVAALIVDNTGWDVFTASTSGLTRFVIDKNGNVGIGTTSPDYPLVVVGTASDGTRTLEVKNSVAGSISNFQVTGDGVNARLMALSSSYSSSGAYAADTVVLDDDQGYAAGLTLLARNSSGYIRMFTGGFDDGNERLRINSTGNVGIGTTSPVGLLHVQGQCVIAGTKIKRRKKKEKRRKQDTAGTGPDPVGDWDYEDVPIEQIEPDDEILSLNQEKGQFEWHKVEQTMNKGLLPALALTTSTGKRIVTTAKHPYLAIDRPETTQGTFEVDQSIKIENLGAASIIGFALGKLAFAVKLPQKDKKIILARYQKKNQKDVFAHETFARCVVAAFKIARIYPARIALDEEYTSYFRRIESVIKESFPDSEIFQTNLKDGSAAHKKVWAVNRGILREDAVLSLESGELKERPGVKSTFRMPLPLVGYRGTSHPHGLYYGEFYSTERELSRAKWVKAAEVRKGMCVATEDGFEKVTGISDAGQVAMYDLQIANTHNFVANGIVAHNTTGKALVDLNTTGDQAVFTASVSGNTKFVINNSGQVGVGTGANNNTLLADVDLRTLTNTVPVASIAGSTGVAALVVDNTAGDLFTASSSGLSRFVIDKNGNVGIGTAAPTALVSLANSNYTTQNMLNVAGTSTGLTTGSLASFDWSPTDWSTSSGNLVNINLGSLADTTGNIFNISDDGSSIFSVSPQQIVNSLPTSFNAAGDVAIAYDINFTNPTASYIKSAAPMYLQAGELFNSSDLTLKTFNKGLIVLDPDEAVTIDGAASVSGQLMVGSTTAAPAQFGKFYVTDSNTATSSAFIENTNTAAAISGLVIKLGSTTLDTTSHFVNFLDLNGKMIGNIRAANTTTVAYQTSGIADFGEWMKVSSDLTNLSNWTNLVSPGTIVCQSADGVEPCEASESARMAGVTSDTTAFLGGEEKDGSVVVGMLGQIRVKIATDSAQIEPGDAIGVAIAGLGKKITSRGYVVGRAMESWSSGQEKVLVYVNPGYFEGPESQLASKLSVDEIQEQVASISANLTNLSNWSNLNSDEFATVSGNLKVLGMTELSNTTIGGSLTVGLVHVDDLLGDVSGLNGSLSLQNGMLTISQIGQIGQIGVNGDLTVSGELTAKKINVPTGVAGASAGKATILAGQSEIEITTSALSANSLIFATPEDVPVAVSTTKTATDKFKIKLDSPAGANIKINWWIIN